MASTREDVEQSSRDLEEAARVWEQNAHATFREPHPSRVLSELLSSILTGEPYRFDTASYTNFALSVHHTMGYYEGREAMNKYLRAVLADGMRKLYERVKDQRGVELLDVYARSWSAFCRVRTTLTRVFSVLDKDLSNRFLREFYDPVKWAGDRLCVSCVPTGQACTVAWRDQVFKKSVVHLREAVLGEIYAERRGRQVSQGPLKITMDSFMAMGFVPDPNRWGSGRETLTMYKKDFEVPLIRATEQFYEEESAQFLAANDCGAYLKMVERRLQDEDERLRNYLHPSSEIILHVCRKILIEDQHERLVSEGPRMIEENNQEDLRRLYGLLGYLQPPTSHSAGRISHVSLRPRVSEAQLASYRPADLCEPVGESDAQCRVNKVRMRDVTSYQVLGNGHSAEVRQGFFALERRNVALKQYFGMTRDLPAVDKQARMLFDNEWKVGAAIGVHRNIVRLLGVVVDDSDEPISIMFELMDHALTAIIYSPDDSYPLSNIVTLLWDVACGLAHLHARNFAHRDIKPANVLVAKDGDEWVAKICDLGFATQRNEMSTFLGTPVYIAPEVTLRQERQVAHEVDMFALGVTVMEAIVRRRPAVGAMTQVIDGRVCIVPERVRRAEHLKLLEASSHDLCELVVLCIADDAAVRPTAEEARDFLAARCMPPRQ